MSIDMARSILLWCAVINYGILLVWFLVFAVAHDWVYHVHGKFFRLSAEQFDAIHYTSMAIYKMGILLFNLVPLVALYVAA